MYNTKEILSKKNLTYINNNFNIKNCNYITFKNHISRYRVGSNIITVNLNTNKIKQYII